jgi:hypothetical protein
VRIVDYIGSKYTETEANEVCPNKNDMSKMPSFLKDIAKM